MTAGAVIAAPRLLYAESGAFRILLIGTAVCTMLALIGSVIGGGDAPPPKAPTFATGAAPAPAAPPAAAPVPAPAPTAAVLSATVPPGSTAPPAPAAPPAGANPGPPAYVKSAPLRGIDFEDLLKN